MKGLLRDGAALLHGVPCMVDRKGRSRFFVHIIKQVVIFTGKNREYD